MRLFELTFFKDRYDEKFSDALARFVKERGLSVSEGGQAKVIWIEGKSWIWRAWFNDPGFERFLEYVQAHPDNPHLPKILSRVREEPVQFKRMPKGMTIKYVKIEKLSELKYLDHPELQSAINLSPAGRRINSYDKYVEYVSQFKDAAPAFELYPDFLKLVFELIHDHRANDINAVNVMMRGNVPVITDPFKD